MRGQEGWIFVTNEKISGHLDQTSLVNNRYVVVNFLFQVIFVFLLFLGMVIYANEVETKEK